jgi:nitrite reductase (NO-forming)
MRFSENKIPYVVAMLFVLAIALSAVSQSSENVKSSASQKQAPVEHLQLMQAQEVQTPEVQTQLAQAENATPPTTTLVDSSQVTYTPDVSFTLETGIAEGQLVFTGVGGTIDGIVNPTLKVEPGAVVQVTLVDGDGAQHDVAFPDFNAKSDLVTGQGSSSTFVFRADQEGSFSYYCTVPGHRQAGMEGVIEVGATQQVAETLPSVVRDPSDVPAPLGQREPTTLNVTL